MYVITFELNEYSTGGEYLFVVFGHKPSIEELVKVFDGDIKLAKHVAQGGGRVEDEEKWYHLTKVESGVPYLLRH